MAYNSKQVRGRGDDFDSSFHITLNQMADAPQGVELDRGQKSWEESPFEKDNVLLQSVMDEKFTSLNIKIDKYEVQRTSLQFNAADPVVKVRPADEPSTTTPSKPSACVRACSCLGKFCRKVACQEPEENVWLDSIKAQRQSFKPFKLMNAQEK